MARSTKRGDQVKQFLLNNIEQNPKHVVSLACNEFGITRQAINRYVRDLEKNGLIISNGNTSQRIYELSVLDEQKIQLDLPGLVEHEVWNDVIEHLFKSFPENINDIWHYGCTEMINNAIDHSSGSKLIINTRIDPVKASIWIKDNGVGIFKKIKDEYNLDDERHAVLELSKGKLTTDPDNHTGKGIFFSSRMFDRYVIISGDAHFSHYSDKDDEDWIWETDNNCKGTSILMSLDNDSKRNWSDVFKKYSSKGSDFGFTKTVVPVHLAKHGLEKLISRSQAKRLMARVDRFKTVFLDFREVETIGQAFADGIFRVYAKNNPEITVIDVNANKDMQAMISRAKISGWID